MKQSKLIKIVDFLSFISLISMLTTGILMEYSLPPKSGPDQIWSLMRHDWGDIHFYSSLVFLSLMAAHLVTHAKFIKSALLGKAKREYKYRIAIGMAGLIALIALMFATIMAPVETGTKVKSWQHQASD